VVTVRVRLTLTAEPVEFQPSRLRDGDGQQARIGSRPVIFGGERLEALVYDRERLQAGDRFAGPAIVTEYSATTVVPFGHRASVDGGHNITIEAG
jgi:N-methylhydantoinase A